MKHTTKAWNIEGGSRYSETTGIPNYQSYLESNILGLGWLNWPSILL